MRPPPAPPWGFRRGPRTHPDARGLPPPRRAPARLCAQAATVRAAGSWSPGSRPGGGQAPPGPPVRSPPSGSDCPGPGGRRRPPRVTCAAAAGSRSFPVARTLSGLGEPAVLPGLRSPGGPELRRGGETAAGEALNPPASGERPAPGKTRPRAPPSPTQAESRARRSPAGLGGEAAFPLPHLSCLQRRGRGDPRFLLKPPCTRPSSRGSDPPLRLPRLQCWGSESSRLPSPKPPPGGASEAEESPGFLSTTGQAYNVDAMPDAFQTAAYAAFTCIISFDFQSQGDLYMSVYLYKHSLYA